MPAPSRPDLGLLELEPPVEGMAVEKKASKKDFDLAAEEPLAKPIDIKAISAHSVQWAKIVAPFGCVLLWLIVAVILLPFLFVGYLDDQEKADRILDWAKTVLSPVVGFGGALIGYYFGARGDLP